MAFHVIVVRSGIDGPDRDRAIAAGPSLVAAPIGYREMLAQAGFAAIEEIDITAGYRTTAAAWVRECAIAADDLKEIYGADEYREDQKARVAAVAAIESGLLGRSMFTAFVH